MDSEYVVKLYTEGKSIREIVAQCGGSPSTVRNVLIRSGAKLRTKSEAQALALQNGKSLHPTAGKKRNQATKLKIADSISSYWKNMPEEEREKRIEKARENWNTLTEAEREEFQKLASEALRKAAKEGSKMEKYLVAFLKQNGYDVVHHKKGLIVNEKLEVDIFLPAKKIVIEIDGPTHFLPIWGETNLQRHVRADTSKSGLLLARGFTIIRVKHLVKNLSEKGKRDISNAILIKLREIENKVLADTERYIELEL
jgi:very-short-patch-repair endonuclease/DNA-binding CsgD family transcriptional regulator